MLTFVINGSRTRRDVIRQVLEEQPVSSQEGLLNALAEMGVHTTQPVLSRDLRAMEVAKRGGFYQLVEQDRVTPLESLRSLLRSTCPAGSNLVVVRCEPGAASAVARALESEGLDGLLGTVAGDDTVFAAVRDSETSILLRKRVDELI